VIVQEYVSEGSLKDMIYRKVQCENIPKSNHGSCVFNLWYLQADADADWSEKYRRRSKGLHNKTVILYGRHILEVTTRA
jgi:hypothetical protein